MNLILQNILLHRNSLLVFAVLLGLGAGKFAMYTRSYTTLVLGIVMVFSFTGFSIRSLVPFKNTIIPFFYSIFLNYVLLSSALVLFAWLLIKDKELFTGFVMIAAAPVGLSVVPFTYMLKGNVGHSIIGVLAIYLSSIILAPVITNLFLDGVEFQTWQLFTTMIELVILPLVISRLLMWQFILKKVEQIRGHIVNWGFAFVIFTVVGINREVFFSEYFILLRIIIVLFICIFILSWIYEKLMCNLFHGKGNIIADVMILTTKSSGFSAVTAMTFYGERAAIPSAVLSIMVLLFLFYKSYKVTYKNKLN